MRKFIKRKSESLWHWEMKCPNYPGNSSGVANLRSGSDVEISLQIPGNDILCPVCIQIEASEKNELRSKEILGDDDLL